MAGKPRGVIRLIWHNFISSFKFMGRPYKLVGKDMHGTEYYEEVQNKTIKRIRPPRYFEPKDGDFQQEVPAEWEAWLRHRRKDPPTLEEVEQNYRLSVLKKVNAARLEEKHRLLKEKDDNLIPQSKENFPVYEEYQHAGRDYKIKKQ